MEYRSYKFEDTVYFGKLFGKTLKGGEVVLLSGALGSGKTAFAKGISKSLAINDIITSPSFPIMNEYQGRLSLYHFDFYRIEDRAEIKNLLEDYLYKSDGIVVIEWGERVFDCIDRYIIVNFNVFDDFRTISIERNHFDTID